MKKKWCYSIVWISLTGMKKIILSSILLSGAVLISSCNKAEEVPETKVKTKENSVAPGVVEKEPEGAVAKLLSASAVILSGEELKKTNVCDAERYIIYYSASW